MLTFGDEPLADLPREDGGILSLVLLDLGDDGRRRDFWLAATDQARRAQRTCNTLERASRTLLPLVALKS